jgi:hypothetical protein
MTDRSRLAPEHIGLCPDSFHMGEFYVPLTAAEVAAGAVRCPENDCDRDMIIYTRFPIVHS